MENAGTWDRKSVISELNQGRDLAYELKRQIYPSTTSREACEFLLGKIFSSYDNALALLNCMDILEMGRSPISERKARWSEQVLLCSGTGQIDDVYNWRKYGQKDILGANHPRSYYRCTHRNTQGCLATKQVKRTDEDPSIFEVVYRGNHSCVQERQKRNKENVNTQTKAENEGQILEVAHEKVETRLFSEPRDFIPFMSPSTSESYLSPSPCQVNDFVIGNDLQSFKTDFTETISNPTSVANFSFEDLDILIDHVDFDSYFLDVADYF
ncbi:hypothetical protein BUALT_Bualt19G0004600 [Buddleja alternifolia]|uniref:WRKY domain-containing protein n=1 Tax=Buddleja alternifolia TaxID=168488 RepID=A0AAV6W113_9LAMI|nr:hypothetical protein BUALT_Bualt19G0004600 [Buddleja alternifolia]